MRCAHFDDISDEWVQEKGNCINPNEELRVERIQTLFKTKIRRGPQHFTPEEFADFLRFKGLARSIPRFLQTYQDIGKVEKVTESLFSTNLIGYTFVNIQDDLCKSKILTLINTLFLELQQLDFVGPAVASACLALCFPELCVTADYIVPALLHNKQDSHGTLNPLYTNPNTADRIAQSLLLPLYDSLSATRARNMATSNYTAYVRELWNIKRVFNLSRQLRKIEEAVWSFGICYLKKNGENQPLHFRSEAHPPKGGPFSKYCPSN